MSSVVSNSADRAVSRAFSCLVVMPPFSRPPRDFRSSASWRAGPRAAARMTELTADRRPWPRQPGCFSNNHLHRVGRPKRWTYQERRPTLQRAQNQGAGLLAVTVGALRRCGCRRRGCSASKRRDNIRPLPLTRERTVRTRQTWFGVRRRPYVADAATHYRTICDHSWQTSHRFFVHDGDHRSAGCLCG